MRKYNKTRFFSRIFPALLLVLSMAILTACAAPATQGEQAAVEAEVSEEQSEISEEQTTAEDGSAEEQTAADTDISLENLFSDAEPGVEEPTDEASAMLAHEFTHCVTDTLLTLNIYANDYGAINEAMSDIMGNLVEISKKGEDYEGAWIIGENCRVGMRSMKNPKSNAQPDFVWDLYYIPAMAEPLEEEDFGGVHSNSSLLNKISYDLYQAGMSVPDQVYYWINVSMAMTPRTDYPQMAELMPWVMEQLGYGKYTDALQKSIAETRIEETGLPEKTPENYGVLSFRVPDAEVLSDYTLFVDCFNFETNESYHSWPQAGTNLAAAVLTPGDYMVTFSLVSKKGGGDHTFTATNAGWQELPDIPNEDLTAEQVANVICTVKDGEETVIETDSLKALLDKLETPVAD